MSVSVNIPTKESILSTWNKNFIHDSKSIPKCSAVYILASMNDFLYVGTSKSLYNRIIANTFDHPVSVLYPMVDGSRNSTTIREYLNLMYNLQVFWLDFSNQDNKARFKLEAKLIKQFDPYLNQVSNRFDFIRSFWMRENLA